MSAGLDTSTVTPGSNAPDASLTVPAIVLVWADAITGQRESHATPTMIRDANIRMPSLPPRKADPEWFASVVQNGCLRVTYRTVGQLSTRAGAGQPFNSRSRCAVLTGHLPPR